jgi:energy-coupling factor transport system permease protein
MSPFSLKASRVQPGSWWLLGISSAVVAGLNVDPIVLLVQIGILVAIILLSREYAPWSQSLKFYLALATFVVAVRVIFRIIFNLADGSSQIALSLPQLSINLGFGGNVSLLGDVSVPSLVAATTDGLRLAAIIISIGLANTLANPRKLLKSTPAALYEIATAISVAINLAPQLIESLQRVRRASALRGRSKGLGALAGTIVPVLEDTIDKSLSLAASMDSRGFGRRGKLSRTQIISLRLISLTSVVLTSAGVFVLLVGTGLQPLALTLLITGLICVLVTVRTTSKNSIRTRFKKETWLLQDYVVVSVAIAAVSARVLGWQV